MTEGLLGATGLYNFSNRTLGRITPSRKLPAKAQSNTEPTNASRTVSLETPRPATETRPSKLLTRFINVSKLATGFCLLDKASLTRSEGLSMSNVLPNTALLLALFSTNAGQRGF